MPQTTSTTATWISDDSGVWNDATNWVGGIVPGITSDVVIDAAVTTNPTIYSSDSVSINSLSVDPGTTGYTTQLVFNSLNVAGAITVTDRLGDGSVNGSLGSFVALKFDSDAVVSASSISVLGGGVYLSGDTVTTSILTTYQLHASGGLNTINGTLDLAQGGLAFIGGYGSELVVTGDVIGNADSVAAPSDNESAVVIDAGATLDVDGALSSAVSMDYFDTRGESAVPIPPGTLILEDASKFSAYVEVSSSLDRVDLVDVAPDSVSITQGTGTVGPGRAVSAQISGTDDTGAAFSFDMVQGTSGTFQAQVTSDGNGGSYVTLVQPVDWVVNTSGDWFTAANWVGDAVPGNRADVLIANTGTGTMMITSSAAITADSLTLDPGTVGGVIDAEFRNDVTIAGTLALAAGEDPEVGDYLTIQDSTLTAAAIVSPDANFAVNSATIDAAITGGIVLRFGVGNPVAGVVPPDTVNGDVSVSSIQATGDASTRVRINGNVDAPAFTPTAASPFAIISGETYIYMSGGYGGTTLEVTGSLSADVFVDDFANLGNTTGTAGLVLIDAPAAFTGDVNLYGTLDHVDLVGVAPSRLTSSIFSFGTSGVTGALITGTDNHGDPISFTAVEHGDGIHIGTGTEISGYIAQLSSDGNGGTFVTLVQANTIDVAADTAVLARPNTVYQGGGNDQFYVDATTIADTINGGGDDSSLGVLNGGTSVMGANITGFGQVHLLGGTPAPRASHSPPTPRRTSSSSAARAMM